MNYYYWFIIVLIFIAISLETGLIEKFTNFAYDKCDKIALAKWENPPHFNQIIHEPPLAGNPCPFTSPSQCPSTKASFEICRRECGDDVVETFFDKPKMWIYVPTEVSARFWSDFVGRRTEQIPPAYIQMCIERQFNLQKSMDVKILSDCDLRDWLSEDEMAVIVNRPLTSLDRANFIKYTLLNKYGGLWMPPFVIQLHSMEFPSYFFDKNNVILFGYKQDAFGRGNLMDDTIVGGGADTAIFKTIADLARRNLQWQTATSNFDDTYCVTLNDLISRNKINLHHFNHNENGRLDKGAKPISVDSMVSLNPTLLANSDMVKMIIIPNEQINSRFKQQYIARLSREQLETSDMWIGKLLRL